MRKKITLVLTAMFVAMFLTACSTIITAEEYKELENIAFEIKNAEVEYKLPEGYKVEYADPTKTNHITIIKVKPSTGKGDNIKATFDITKSEPELISIEQEFSDYMGDRIYMTFWITVIITVIIIASLRIKFS